MLIRFIAVALAVSTLESGLRADLTKYLAARAKPEHISGISLSVSLTPSAQNINVAVGSAQYGGRGPAITPATLYQIGSNTKSFTSAAILQLEAEGKLNIDQTTGKWLPQYRAWKSITIRRLLNMTSDIPTYDDVPSMLAAYAANPTKYWTPQALVAVVYPRLKPNAGWLYSNTAYILLQMIIERASGKSYASEITRRFIRKPALHLNSTYYVAHLPPPAIAQRMTSGYFFSTDADNAALGPLVGQDMRMLSLSWAQGAGAVVSTAEDVTRWSRALYEGPLLRPKQRAELETLVSIPQGKPLAVTTAATPRGFGLGVGALFMQPIGHVWFYEGETLGYRMTYVYLPKSNAVIAIGMNSQPNKKEDKVGELILSVYRRLREAGKL